MLTCKQSPTTRIRYGSNRGEAELREALAFLFLVKGREWSKHMPSVDEFFYFCRRLNAEIVGGELARPKATEASRATHRDGPLGDGERKSVVGGFVDFLIPWLRSRDRLDKLFQILTIVQHALVLHAYVKQSTIRCEEAFWTAEALHAAAVHAVITEYEFDLPLGWFFRNILTLFGTTITETVMKYDKHILETMCAPGVHTITLHCAVSALTEMEAVAEKIGGELCGVYFRPVLRVLKKIPGGAGLLGIAPAAAASEVSVA